MAEYQVLARKYRPQTFQEVVGQEAIVQTLKNAIKNRRLAHAYLFCGSRGTGKTTIARVFAKALNCLNPTESLEPCNACTSCKEITSGNSLDVMEIDGASHRGIDDIRQINENVGYATSSGKYKIYIIDEVHMLTKEAFNALLKTLEEPPPKVKFFFATTEPHKVLPTILSRCQRFNLGRIPVDQIADKLRSITREQGISIQEDALRLLANRADGGLRDAESLLDQIIAFHEGEITVGTIAEVLGIMPKDQLFELDNAAKEGNYAFAFELAHKIFSQGKDITHFVENLTEHFRNILLVKLSGKNAPFLALSAAERDRYEASAKLYSQEQCVTILDFLIEAQNQIRFLSSARIPLEALLLRIVRIHQRIPVDFLVRRLTELEEKLFSDSSEAFKQRDPQPTQSATTLSPSKPLSKEVHAQEATQQNNFSSSEPVKPKAEVPVPKAFIAAPEMSEPSKPADRASVNSNNVAPKNSAPTNSAPSPSNEKAPSPSLAEMKNETQEQTSKPLPDASSKGSPLVESSLTEDPTPSPADLGIRKKVEEPTKPAPLAPPPQNSRYDTILQFTAIELEGTIQKKLNR